MNPGRSEWNRPAGDPAWPHDEVHIWRSTVDWTPESLDRLRQVLSPDERARVDRFIFEKDQRSHLVSRGWLLVFWFTFTTYFFRWTIRQNGATATIRNNIYWLAICWPGEKNLRFGCRMPSSALFLVN